MKMTSLETNGYVRDAIQEILICGVILNGMPQSASALLELKIKKSKPIEKFTLITSYLKMTQLLEKRSVKDILLTM